jgi:F-type H+-transporting ATPase subunit epsilon
MKLDLATPEKVVFEGEISSVTAPGTLGYFQILEGHAPFLTTLRSGTVTIIVNDQTQLKYQITGGILECSSNKIHLLADNLV